MKLLLLAVLLLAQPLTTRLYAQELPPLVQHEVDSLQKELIQKHPDTTNLKIRYRIGRLASIQRIGYWDSLLSEAVKCNSFIYQNMICLVKGVLYAQQGQTKQALFFFRKSYIAGLKSKNKDNILFSLYNMATFFFNISDTKNTIEYCYKALPLAEERKDSAKISGLYALIGVCYFSAGNTAKALNIHLKCLKLYKKLRNDNEIVSMLCNIGTDYIALGDTATGMNYFLQCRKYEPLQLDRGLQISLNNSIGAAYSWLHKYDLAGKYCTRAYQLATEDGNKRFIASALSTLAEAYYYKGNYKKAREAALEGMEILKTTYFPLQVPAFAFILKNIYTREGNYKEALRMFELYVATRDSLTSEHNKKQTLQKEFDYNLEKKEKENEILSQQNQIQALQLSQSNYLIWGLGAGFLFVFIISTLFLRQNKLHAAQQNMQMEQKLLRSQMNPHFIFNSLQAIQNYILKQESVEAVKYLSSFANITRAVLESSRMDYIPLQKEITLLENYLQLQKLRFGNRFDYIIHVDEDVDVEQISIPPMLSQPFIENAVEHGMHDIEEGGRIDVFYSLKKNFLNIEIIDNGWGMNHKNQPAKKHQSLAMQITKERVALMNRKKKDKTVFTIAEAFPMAPERKGVKVSFFLPLQMSS